MRSQLLPTNTRHHLFLETLKVSVLTGSIQSKRQESSSGGWGDSVGRVLPAKPNYPRSISSTHMVERENELMVVLSSSHACTEWPRRFQFCAQDPYHLLGSQS